MENILPSVHALGERHYSYGVKPEYYQSAVQSFVWSLEQHLGDQFTAELKEAWRMAFQSLADTMLSVYGSQ
jgi:hemoglobin-like flavoprotein